MREILRRHGYIISAPGIYFNVTLPFFIGMAITALLLVYEHSLVKSHDLSKLNKAFFDMNGYISITIFAFTVISFVA